MPRRKNKKDLQEYDDPSDDTTVLLLEGRYEKEIWDGADLVLMRERTNELRVQCGIMKIKFDMRNLLYLPSGTFGMFCDNVDYGCDVFVANPTLKVQTMLWFRRFLAGNQCAENVYQLLLNPEAFLELDPYQYSAIDARNSRAAGMLSSQ